MQLNSFQTARVPRFGNDEPRKPTPTVVKAKPAPVTQSTPTPKRTGGKLLGWALALSAVANVGQLVHNRSLVHDLQHTQQSLDVTSNSNEMQLSSQIKDFLYKMDMTKAKVTDLVNTPALKKVDFTIGEEKYTLVILPKQGQYQLEGGNDFTHMPQIQYFEHGYNAPNPPDKPAVLFNQADRAYASLNLIQAIVRRESRDERTIALVGEHLKSMETKLFAPTKQ